MKTGEKEKTYKKKEKTSKKKEKTSNFWPFIIIFIIIIVLYFLYTKNANDRILKTVKKTFDITSYEEFDELGEEDESDESDELDELDEEDELDEGNGVNKISIIKNNTNNSKKKWKREELCRNIFESIYKVEFRSCRPNFLKNPKTNRNLELDGYNSDLQIAFEHNGHQHYEYPNVFHRTEEDFIYQLEKDEHKRKVCERLKIHLIIIKFDIPEDEMKSYIISQISKNPY